jgi:hypothetical protein
MKKKLQLDRDQIKHIWEKRLLIGKDRSQSKIPIGTWQRARMKAEPITERQVV